MVHVMQQRQMIPWLMPDLLFNLSPLKGEYDTSLKILHDLTESVIKSKREEVARHEKKQDDVDWTSRVFGSGIIKELNASVCYMYYIVCRNHKWIEPERFNLKRFKYFLCISFFISNW